MLLVLMTNTVTLLCLDYNLFSKILLATILGQGSVKLHPCLLWRELTGIFRYSSAS